MTAAARDTAEETVSLSHQSFRQYRYGRVLAQRSRPTIASAILAQRYGESFRYRLDPVTRGTLTVGSDPTSCVMPAVSPTVLLSSFRNTHAEVAGSLNGQVRHANMSVLLSRSSLGYSMLELCHRMSADVDDQRVWNHQAHHSRQKRKVIFLGNSTAPSSTAFRDITG